MKRNILLALTTITMTFALLFSAAGQVQRNPNTSPTMPGTGPAGGGRVNYTMLPCKNSGGHQDVSKNMVITNTTSKTITSNTLVYYSATDGDKDSVYPSSDIAPGKTGTIHGKAGQNYTCTAKVFLK
ncbi:MAG: hypothetical protein ABI977_06625 [Acidobacteriota bacterium]